jgi:cytoskeletal protein CcmA (bactofilin family)
VRVEGVFAGEIQTKGTVHVMDGAQVDAKIRAAFVLISGSFQGEIRCEQRVDLLPRARVSGEIYTRGFTCQEGARLDARVQMSGGAEAETPRAGRTARTATIDEPLTSRAAAAAAANSRSIDE